MAISSNESGIIISIDLGTSNLKVAAFDLKGQEIGYESIEYKLHSTANGIVENDPEKYWGNLVKILKKLGVSLGDRKKEIIAIGTTSQGETIIPININGEPLRNAIVWLDKRSVGEAKEISKNFDENKLFVKTGQPKVDASWPATRILWIKRNESEIFSQTYKFLLLEDFIIYKITGNFFGESSVYNSSYYYDIVKFKYIDEVLNFLDIDKEKLPEIVKPGTYIGKVKNDVALDIGFPKRTKVVIGAMDQICGAVGSGNIKKGLISETTGTAFAMVASIDKPIFNKETRLPCYMHAVPDLYTLLPYSFTGGMVLKWFKDNFCQNEIYNSKNKRINVYDILTNKAAEVLPGSEGLIMLPHLAGAYFPEYNSKARGVYFGIGLNHTIGHFIRAIMESLGYMIRANIDSFDSLGIKPKKIISVGGGAKSPLWCQIKSDITGIKIEVPEYTETALLGAAILASVNIGEYNSIEQACSRFIKIRRKYKPNIKNREIYDDSYRKYESLYKSLENQFL